jgi:predicted kinase
MSASAATLYIMSGLPGVGKSTLAQVLAGRVGGFYLRIDTIEQKLRDFGVDVQGEGYVLSYAIAAENLRLGLSVIADSCNPIEITRSAWRGVAEKCGARYFDIEVVCSDKAEHRRRVEQRPTHIDGLRLPTWQEVEARMYDPWTSKRLIVDTAGRDIVDSVTELMQGLSLRP